ncbi:hypothetical protein [Puerhibacterium sp. TATVAM-FAB25]|uniref:hypothetical protein n=1 Tax=Puerhibacterium sp. TATVAM-FAB25 TaxID=3093699 RepID=UPI00397E0347
MRTLGATRSLPAGPRSRLAGALVIAALVLSVVTMHAMSGSSTAHVSPAAVTAAADHHAPAAATAPAHVQAGGEHDAGACDGDCGHHATTAMCLMVVAALLTLAAPGQRTRFPAGVAGRCLHRLGPVVGRHRPAPSLDALGISRT